MVDYGVTDDEGFVSKNYVVILDELQAEARNLFGTDIDLTETSPLEIFLEIIALEMQRLWEMSESFYYSGYVDFATGTSLDRVGVLVGIERKAATEAVGTVTFSGVDNTVILEGTIVMTSTGVEFTTDADGTISGGTVDVEITAVLPGADGNVGSNTITELKTPIVGVDSLTNADACTDGTDIEADDVLRDRIKGSLVLQAKGTLEAIRQAVLAVTGVTGCSATEDINEHSALLMVDGVSKPNADVDDAIEDTRPAGIKVTWDIPTDVDIYVTITVDVNSYAPGDAASQVETAIINYITGLNVGADVVYKKIVDVVFDIEEDEATPWIIDISNLKIGKTASPTGEVNIVIASDEVATTDGTKVVETINVIAAT